ncbi:MAG: peptidase T [Bacteroidaceae bacterium]|nr:peptidase T [Bacteroidaceae bacterium]
MVIERFLRYVRFETTSSETSETTPSTPGQMTFASALKNELLEMGLEDVSLDDNGYLFATLPSNTERDIPTIGFIAHLDTSPDMSGKNVNPRIVKNYQGEDIPLCAEEDIILSPSQFPELKDHIGEDLIVTDGHTLLGADDKAGIAEIVSAIEYLQKHPEIKHGKIRIGFNPDEEIGLGAHKFDVKRFGCDWAYTMDGSEVGEIEYENFNAAAATITIQGRNVHPGYAKGKMLNAIRLAAEVVADFPMQESPEQTEGYEGFYHPTSISGTVDKATISFIIRDHDHDTFEKRKDFIQTVVNNLNEKYEEIVASAEVRNQYANMREVIEPIMYVIDIACEAVRRAGAEPKIKAIRGGTDGAQLSFMELPCPNIFAGGLNFHSRYEYVPVQSMQKAMMTIVHIAELVAQQ